MPRRASRRSHRPPPPRDRGPPGAPWVLAPGGAGSAPESSNVKLATVNSSPSHAVVWPASDPRPSFVTCRTFTLLPLCRKGSTRRFAKFRLADQPRLSARIASANVRAGANPRTARDGARLRSGAHRGRRALGDRRGTPHPAEERRLVPPGSDRPRAPGRAALERAIWSCSTCPMGGPTARSRPFAPKGTRARSCASSTTSRTRPAPTSSIRRTGPRCSSWMRAAPVSRSGPQTSPDRRAFRNDPGPISKCSPSTWRGGVASSQSTARSRARGFASASAGSTPS